MNICTSDDFHPYECKYQTCIHCNKIKSENHEPKQCWLCCNGDPELNKETA